MRHVCRLAAFLGCVTVLATGLSRAENWPQWRGPAGNNTSAETGLPLTWSETAGLAWKCSLPEWGNSTPAVWDDAVFLTSHVDESQLVLVKIDRRTGRIAWTRQVGTGTTYRIARGTKIQGERRRQVFHNGQNMATPSPATDGQLVVVHFGNGDLAAYDYTGAQLWHRNLQKDHGSYTIWWGHANSPVLYEDLVISLCIQDFCSDLPGEPSSSYLEAHDKRTGRQRWFTLRKTAAELEDCDAYTTPAFWRRDGHIELLAMGGQMLDSSDPATGRRLWSLPDLEGSRVSTGPFASGDMVYATCGKRGPLLGIRPGGPGQRPPEDILWQDPDATPDSPTPVVTDGLLFTVSDSGIAKCLDARTGKVQWQERLKGQYRASPLAADGRIYFLNMDGLATVIAAAARFERLAENKLDDTFFATPVVSDGRIFLRGRKSLYCVQK